MKNLKSLPDIGTRCYCDSFKKMEKVKVTGLCGRGSVLVENEKKERVIIHYRKLYHV